MADHSAPVAEGEVDFAKISIKEAFSLLNATHAGLSDDEAKKRIAEFGPNKLPESSVNPFLRFLGYLWNPLSWAMEVAAILAIILLDYADFALITALLLLNAGISYVEESNADKAIKALAGALAPKCKALRSGKVITMDAAEIVPGDILIVRLGDIVPADIKLLGEEGDTDEQPMQIDQAALTGESLPVKKFTGDVAFSGSTIKQGERHAVVYATGINTFFGRAAALIGSTNNVANIQKIMTKIGAVCLVTIGLWCIIQLIVQFAIYKHGCRLGVEACPTLTNLLVIIVGGIPIAMPTVLSVTLALGASQLAKHGAIVARMSAVEEMAGMDILCSDKTGTLTLNKLSVDQNSLYPMCGHDNLSLLTFAALSANTVTEEAIDMVLFNSHPEKDTIWNNYKLLKFIPFNPTDKYTMAIISDNKTGQVLRLMKGAPQVVLKRAHNVDEIADEVEAKIVEYANRGYRALAVARADGDGPADAPGTKWVFIGLLPLFDPPRHDTKETIERCQELGINVKMVTGDQLLIGIETAKQLGMGTDMHKVDVLLRAKAGGELVAGHATVDELVEKADGFAEVFPEHKYEIVKILQDRNHMLGMTGDGVNDAPALKKADVGIAVHGATDAARGAADIVLTEAGLSVIVSAVIGARKIFQRMTTYAKYAVATTFRICFTYGLLTVIYNFYFPTILIVLLAVFNDGAMIALSKDRVVPSPTPNTWRLRNIFITGIVYGLYLTLSSWALYHLVAKTDFTERVLKGYSLQDSPEELTRWCRGYITTQLRKLPSAPLTAVYPEGSFYLPAGSDPTDFTLLNQCVTEQSFVRQSMQRTLMYAQVSISGQALVFVTRSQSAEWSVTSRAGIYTYIAFLAAQIGATLIAAFGFDGYPEPAQDAIHDCRLCARSDYEPVQFFAGVVPLYGTEGRFVASVVGCTYYVILAWVWSLIWHLALDPIKWGMAYALNDDGVRSMHTFRKWLRGRARPATKTGEENYVAVGAAAANYANPLGRASVVKPSSDALARASMIKIETDQKGGLRRVSATPYQRNSVEAQAMTAQLAGHTVGAANPLMRLSTVARGSPGMAAAAAADSAKLVKRNSLPV